ncbi:MAG: SGNH/GDSL hydrolase family protein, partial [Verrucomicrobiaceae bacterium]|nr:SGNH/GDSL hydrolase family protein [Verrucomicrobiaceae bacterium]
MIVSFHRLVIVLVAVLAAGSGLVARPLPVHKGESIVILGNTFAERMQLFGYFETFLHCRFPEHRLRVRNMAWSADEVDLQIRPRGFPDLFEELKEHKADLLFLCFGLNESFAGAAGVEGYQAGLTRFLNDLQGEQFNGTSSPRIVLVSPLAFEAAGGVVADQFRRNENLKRYTAASAEVAAREGVRFLNLMEPTGRWIARHPDRRLTFNGIHLTEYGDWVVSRMM